MANETFFKVIEDKTGRFCWLAVLYDERIWTYDPAGHRFIQNGSLTNEYITGYDSYFYGETLNFIPMTAKEATDFAATIPPVHPEVIEVLLFDDPPTMPETDVFGAHGKNPGGRS